ncbi:hypothetical protein GCM10023320_24220 [Pseudonocardia adelaidensis]|uniref:Trypsin-like peptidase n=1 Tax=Pseudonocardia adelaidensis TaxID=648754 RepID=A0ABP9NH28_9PSEU
MSGAAALAEPPPAAPVPSPGPAATAPNVSEPASPAAPAAPPPQAAPLNSLIDPALLESVQQSIVGLVIVWSEHEDPFAWLTTPPDDPAAPPETPLMSICTGWFDTPTTIATAGHCVDPEEGRVAMHMERGGIDPETGLPTPVDYSRPAPTATVYAFQPRELPGAVLTSPVIVRVHSFRTAEDGDTAKFEVHGMAPGKPLPIAPTAPRLGEPVVSIGFPGLNISDTDGINMDKLLEGGGQTPADVLQDSRLQPVNTSGTIMSRQFRKGVAVYQVNADFAGGLSGGPTINTRGEVYGINSMMTLTLFGGGNFNVITDTGMLREFLEHDQPAQPQPQSQPQVQPQPEPAAAAAPAAAPSVALAPAIRASAPPAPTDAAGAPDGSLGWIIASSVVAGAVLGGLVVLRLRQNRSTPPASDSGGATPEPATA